jgi:hypothetical protein
MRGRGPRNEAWIIRGVRLRWQLVAATLGLVLNMNLQLSAL